MYGIALGSAECPVFYEDRGKQSFEFTLSETRVIVDSLLDRKARNNGVGKYLFDTLRIKGECRYDFPKNSEPLAFYCKASGNGKYAVTLLGAYSHELIGRLNRSRQQLRAITVTRNIRVRRRELRAQGLYTRLVKRELPRALAGASGNFKLHFENSQITCSDAIVVIAYAAKLDRHWVRNRLVRSLDKRSVASLRLKGGFVFRVDLACEWRGLLDLSSPVQIRTTDDNTHGAYRRLRNALRKRLKKERKARVAAQKKISSREKDSKGTPPFSRIKPLLFKTAAKRSSFLHAYSRRLDNRLYISNSILSPRSCSTLVRVGRQICTLEESRNKKEPPHMRWLV